MRLSDHEAQTASAAIQLLERDVADRLEANVEPTVEHAGISDEARHAVDDHDRLTHVVRKLQTGGFHDLFDWEVEVVRTGLQRYQAALNDSEPHAPIADANSRYIIDDEQRQTGLRRTAALLDRFPGRHS